jgi:hypothetical protein
LQLGWGELAGIDAGDHQGIQSRQRLAAIRQVGRAQLGAERFSIRWVQVGEQVQGSEVLSQEGINPVPLPGAGEGELGLCQLYTPTGQLYSHLAEIALGKHVEKTSFRETEGANFPGVGDRPVIEAEPGLPGGPQFPARYSRGSVYGNQRPSLQYPSKPALADRVTPLSGCACAAVGNNRISKMRRRMEPRSKGWNRLIPGIINKRPSFVPPIEIHITISDRFQVLLL